MFSFLFLLFLDILSLSISFCFLKLLLSKFSILPFLFSIMLYFTVLTFFVTRHLEFWSFIQIIIINNKQQSYEILYTNFSFISGFTLKALRKDFHFVKLKEIFPLYKIYIVSFYCSLNTHLDR